MGNIFAPKRIKRKSKYFNQKNTVGLIVIIVMVSSLLAVSQDGSNALDDYKDHKFKLKNNDVVTKIDDKEVTFDYHPLDLVDIEVPLLTTMTLKDANMIYLSFNPEDELISDIETARMTFTKKLYEEFNVFAYEGISQENILYEVLPIVSCENATDAIPAVIFETGEAINVTQEGNCIYLKAAYGSEFGALIDRIRYAMYGIMD